MCLRRSRSRSCASKIGSSPSSSRRRTIRSSSAPRRRVKRGKTWKSRSKLVSASCQRNPRRASSAAAATSSRCNGYCARTERPGTPWCVARAAKARPRLLRSSRGGWCARTRFAVPSSSLSRRSATRKGCSMPSDASSCRSIRSRRSKIWNKPSCRRARSHRAVHVAGRGQHGEHSPAALRRGA